MLQQQTIWAIDIWASANSDPDPTNPKTNPAHTVTQTSVAQIPNVCTPL